MSRNEEFHNEMGVRYGPARPDFDFSHEGLVKYALDSWVKSPMEMGIHAHNVMGNYPAGRGAAQSHAAASSLLTELWDRADRAPTLYRGTHPKEQPGIKSYSERKEVAEEFARNYKGSVVSLPNPVGVQMSKFVNNNYDASERQWIVDETDPRNKR